MRFGWAIASLLTVLSVVAGVRAQDGVGEGATGMAALGRVPALAGSRSTATVAGTGGYGLLESQPGESGSHHRLRGAAALAVRPVEWLGLWMRFDGRIDLHPRDMMGSDSSLTGEPRFGVRAGGRLGESLRLGVELGLWLPGGDAPSVELGASTLDAIGIATLAPPGSGLTVSLFAGYRLDNSGASIAVPKQLRRGDYSALGVSEYDAVLFGGGLGWRSGSVELYADATVDLFVGTGGVSVTPAVRAGAGVRIHASDALAFELGGEVLAAGERVTVFDLGEQPLVPIEPRFSVHAGLRLALGLPPAEPVGGGGRLDPRNDRPPPPPTATTGTIRGRIVDADGAPVANARIALPAEGEAPAREVTTLADGTFSIPDVPAGERRLAVTAEGFDPSEIVVTVTAGQEIAAPETRIARPAPPPAQQGQLRGLIRSYRGAGLRATVRVAPAEGGTAAPVEAQTDEDGFFQLDVPPGAYRVEIESAGYQSQNRNVRVEENGVTVLNVELREGRRRR